MKRLVLLLSITVFFGCTNSFKKKGSQKVEYALQHTVKLNPLENVPYIISLSAKKKEEKKYALEIKIDLNEGAYFVSPNAKRDFKGKFTFNIKDNTYFEKIGKLEEHPKTVEEYDDHPFVNGTVNWVRQNTSYTLPIVLKTNKDFEVSGHIQFTIEPRCTLEKIPYIIRFKNGQLQFEIFGC